MEPRFVERDFVDGAALAAALAEAVAEDLRNAIAQRGRALLAVSGGTTPREFLHALSNAPLQWPRVTVTLCDERWQPPQHPRSNARLVHESLLRGAAAAAAFVPLYADSPDPEPVLTAIEQRIERLRLPLDIAVLGLGLDGHTASLFPDGDRFEQALDPAVASLVLPMRAPSAGEPRITLTLPPIAGARNLYLQIEGAEKKAVFQQIVRADGAFARSPLRALMRHAKAQLNVYWCE